MTARRRPTRPGTPRVAVVTSTIPMTIVFFDEELIRQVQAQGYDVCVVSSPGPALDRIGAEMGVRVRALPMTREISPVADLIALFAWLRVCLTERPSLLIAATPKASLLSMLAGRLTRVERRLYCMVGLRLEGESGNRRRLLGSIEKLTSWAATDVVANSPSLAARYAELRLAPEPKLRHIRPGSDHGVDSNHFCPRPPDLLLARSLGIDHTVPVVGLIGRLTHDKGVDDLISAMGILQSEGISCQLLVVGPQDEPDSAAYLETLTFLGGHVVSVGAVEDVRPYFALMAVHVLPSLREGFPNVVLEASAMGLPTIATDATGAIDSVRHGVTGLTVKTQNPPDLARAIKTLLGDPRLASRYGVEAREWVIKDFQPKSVVQTVLAFDNPVGRRGAPAIEHRATPHG